METTLTGGSDAKLEGESEARVWNLEEGRRGEQSKPWKLLSYIQQVRRSPPLISFDNGIILSLSVFLCYLDNASSGGGGEPLPCGASLRCQETVASKAFQADGHAAYG